MGLDLKSLVSCELVLEERLLMHFFFLLECFKKNLSLEETNSMF